MVQQINTFEDAPREFADGEFQAEVKTWRTEYDLSAAIIGATFNASMSRRAIPMPNPTELLTVIGRDILNYCSNYGEE